MRVLEAFAEVLSIHLDEAFGTQKEIKTSAQQIRTIIQRDALRIVYHSIYGIADHRLRAFECPSRLDAEPRLSPDHWFDLAH